MLGFSTEFLNETKDFNRNFLQNRRHLQNLPVLYKIRICCIPVQNEPACAGLYTDLLLLQGKNYPSSQLAARHYFYFIVTQLLELNLGRLKEILYCKFVKMFDNIAKMNIVKI